jgi:hypothetical protein
MTLPPPLPNPTAATVAALKQVTDTLDPVEFYLLMYACGMVAKMMNRMLGAMPDEPAARQAWEANVRSLNLGQFIDQVAD